MKGVEIPAGWQRLDGDVEIPEGAKGLVVFVQAPGGARGDPADQRLAGLLREAGFATLLVDLLTDEEVLIDRKTKHLRFDVEFLAKRLADATTWAAADPDTGPLPVGYLAASSGAAAALMAAEGNGHVKAVVSRGGRPDLAGPVLGRVAIPALLVVGEADWSVLRMNQEALSCLTGVRELRVVPGASHLFDEPGALETVARLATDWFDRFLTNREKGGIEFRR